MFKTVLRGQKCKYALIVSCLLFRAPRQSLRLRHDASLKDGPLKLPRKPGAPQTELFLTFPFQSLLMRLSSVELQLKYTINRAAGGWERPLALWHPVQGRFLKLPIFKSQQVIEKVVSWVKFT